MVEGVPEVVGEESAAPVTSCPQLSTIRLNPPSRINPMKRSGSEQDPAPVAKRLPPIDLGAFVSMGGVRTTRGRSALDSMDVTVPPPQPSLGVIPLSASDDSTVPVSSAGTTSQGQSEAPARGGVSSVHPHTLPTPISPTVPSSGPAADQGSLSPSAHDPSPSGCPSVTLTMPQGWLLVVRGLPLTVTDTLVTRLVSLCGAVSVSSLERLGGTARASYSCQADVLSVYRVLRRLPPIPPLRSALSCTLPADEVPLLLQYVRRTVTHALQSRDNNSAGDKAGQGVGSNNGGRLPTLSDAPSPEAQASDRVRSDALRSLLGRYQQYVASKLQEVASKEGALAKSTGYCVRAPLGTAVKTLPPEPPQPPMSRHDAAQSLVEPFAALMAGIDAHNAVSHVPSVADQASLLESAPRWGGLEGEGCGERVRELIGEALAQQVGSELPPPSILASVQEILGGRPSGREWVAKLERHMLDMRFSLKLWGMLIYISHDRNYMDPHAHPECPTGSTSSG
ncbi:hypothetical protein KIPB_011237 [Kipferlia bialata]|uniref:Uncharacterized protein n=1 Tax=Kipferlia bialata TaxID=797122 RepID=A0A9K3GMZ3_9EUKA|nr:hypothetical protein KIPB_011237 [Kipferlia bialata]|eukprot:g11237.t1